MNYKERVKAGLCGKCGEKVESGSLCPKHREEAKERAAAKRVRNRASGKCLNDNRPAVSGGKCQVCIDKAKISRDKTTAARKAAGLCTACGKPAKAGCTLCQRDIDKLSATSSKHYARRKAAGTCCYCKAAPEPGHTMCADHLEQTRQQRERLKREVMEAYGGAKCCRCSEVDLRFLEIDHIDGGGRKHLREVVGGGAGHALYGWLKRNNFPPGFRVLCRPCNSKAHVDRCRANGTLLTAAPEV